MLLNAVGVTCLCSESPEEALVVSESSRVDCAVTEVGISDFDGVELAYELKARLPGIPVYGLSAESMRTEYFVFDRVFEHPGALSLIVAEILKRLSRGDTSGIF